MIDETKVRFTSETVKCRPIDAKKLSEHLDASIHQDEQVEKNKVYRVRDILAIVMEPRHALIDDEFCGTVSGKYEFYAYAEWDSLDENNRVVHTFETIPSYKFEFDIADLIPYLLPETTLAEFSKGRRGYNGRIIKNEYSWMKYFNGEEK